jgi:hypothetical protein
VVVDEAVFDLVARLEIQKALRLQYPVSLLTIRAEAEGEIPKPSQLATKLSRVFSAVVRGTDLVVAAPAALGILLHLLLVDAHHADLPVVIHRIRDEIKHHRFRVNGARLAVRLAVGAASFPTTASSLDDLRAQAAAAATTQSAVDDVTA